MKWIMKFLGSHMKVVMKYCKDQNEVYNEIPRYLYESRNEYPKGQNEINNEILRHSYDNCNEIP